MAAMRASTSMGTTFAAACLAAGGADGAATARAASAAYRSAARPRRNAPSAQNGGVFPFGVKERETQQISAPPSLYILKKVRGGERFGPLEGAQAQSVRRM